MPSLDAKKTDLGERKEEISFPPNILKNFREKLK